ncbi:hypothetical protein AX16_008337 [Volvariella volvacea WC 439]|nr:hypothetical protein AX16_008337 [Volvariella volvacea WC 439]
MRAKTSLPLDDDVLDRVFFFLPDFATLQSLILTAKPLFAVFQAHPNSITRAICYNVVGPSLPQAIRLIRYKKPAAAESDLNNDTADAFSSAPVPWSETDPISPITKDEVLQLVQNASIVNELEGIFVRRHKDRSLQAKLSPFESWRFRRAMYRLMLFVKTFSLEDLELSGDEEEDVSVIEEIAEQQQSYLEEFPTDELKELFTVADFLSNLVCSMVADHGGSFEDWFEEAVLACGPGRILDAYKTAEPYELEGYLQEQSIFEMDLDGELAPLVRYLLHPLEAIWGKRKAKPPEETTHWKSILEGCIIDSQDRCQNCDMTRGSELWNESNWETLQYTRIGKNWLHTLFKGDLSRNTIELAFFDEIKDKPSFTYHNMMKRMFKTKLSGFDSWTEQDWLCMNCVKEFITSHLHLWFLEKKREERIPIPNDDCWYGYNCRTQRKKDHAQKLNHLAAPKPKVN